MPCTPSPTAEQPGVIGYPHVVYSILQQCCIYNSVVFGEPHTGCPPRSALSQREELTQLQSWLSGVYCVSSSGYTPSVTLFRARERSVMR
jgi:hypothetical protein